MLQVLCCEVDAVFSTVLEGALPCLPPFLISQLLPLQMQVLCCEVDAVFRTVLEDAELCGSLFTLLDQPRPLDCMLAGYFARVLVCLLMRRSHDLLRYLKVRRRCQGSALLRLKDILQCVLLRDHEHPSSAQSRLGCSHQHRRRHCLHPYGRRDHSRY